MRVGTGSARFSSSFQVLSQKYLPLLRDNRHSLSPPDSHSGEVASLNLSWLSHACQTQEDRRSIGVRGWRDRDTAGDGPQVKDCSASEGSPLRARPAAPATPRCERGGGPGGWCLLFSSPTPAQRRQHRALHIRICRTLNLPPPAGENPRGSHAADGCVCGGGGRRCFPLALL